MSEPTIRNASLGHFFDGDTRINVRCEAGKLAFSKHKSSTVTYAPIPFMELYHSSVGQLPLEGMAAVWGLKPHTPQPPAPEPTPVTPVPEPTQPNLIEEGITP